MRDQPRRRRAVGPLALRLLRPAFRYSAARDAYVLRVAGGQYGPVFVPRGAAPSPSQPTAPVGLSEPVIPPTGRFARSDGADLADGADAPKTQTRQR